MRPPDRTRRQLFLFLWVLAAGAVIQGPAHADTDNFAHVTGEVAVEFKNEYAFNSNDPAAEQNELGTRIEPFVSFFLTEHLSINTGLVLEAVEDPGPMENRIFADHGLFAEVLTVAYETDQFSLYGGKFGPNFSIAFDAAAGVFGTDMSEDDLELAEFVGFGGSYTFRDTGLGSLTTSASVFTADRSFLSNSAFTKRGQTSLIDGGPGNTNGLKSYAIAIDGDDIPGLDGLRYHVGFVHLATDTGPAEGRLAIAAEWGIELANGVTMTPLVEYVHFWNADGNRNESRNYYTVSLLTEFNSWNVTLAFTGRNSKFTDMGASRLDYQAQVSAGYTFANNISIDVGYKNVREDGIKTDIVGAQLTYLYEF